MKSVYKTSGTCARAIEAEVEDGIIKDVRFIGGCEGNLQGISRLLTGMDVEEAMNKLRGIRCGRKNTSCPDQLSHMLEEMLEQSKNAYNQLT